MSFHQIWTGEGNNSGTDNSELTPPLIPRNMFDDYRAQVINNIEQYILNLIQNFFHSTSLCMRAQLSPDPKNTSKIKTFLEYLILNDSK